MKSRTLQSSNTPFLELLNRNVACRWHRVEVHAGRIFLFLPLCFRELFLFRIDYGASLRVYSCNGACSQHFENLWIGSELRECSDQKVEVGRLRVKVEMAVRGDAFPRRASHKLNAASMSSTLTRETPAATNSPISVGYMGTETTFCKYQYIVIYLFAMGFRLAFISKPESHSSPPESRSSTIKGSISESLRPRASISIGGISTTCHSICFNI